MKLASVYHYKGKLLVLAMSKTTDGVWIGWEPRLAVAEDADPRAIGQAIVAALDGSLLNVPHPTNWKAVLSPLLALAGVKSWAAFAKFAAYVGVTERDGDICLMPTRNLGPTRGFENIQSGQVFTTRDDLTRLGVMAVEALRASK